MRLPNYEEWMQEQVFEQTYYLDQLISDDPGQYMMIAGPPGIGKSTLVIHLCFALATGSPFLGFPTFESGLTIGYLALEGAPSDTKYKMGIIRQAYPGIFKSDAKERFRYRMDSPLLLEFHYDKFLKIFEGCKIIVIDNLRQITTSQYLKPEYAAKFIKVFEKLLRELSAAGIVTHHIRKSGDDRYLLDPADIFTLKGASEYAESATSILMMERKRHGRDTKTGQYIKSNPEDINIYFPKARIARNAVQGKCIETRRNYSTYCFEVTSPLQ